MELRDKPGDIHDGSESLHSQKTVQDFMATFKLRPIEKTFTF